MDGCVKKKDTSNTFHSNVGGLFLFPVKHLRAVKVRSVRRKFAKYRDHGYLRKRDRSQCRRRLKNEEQPMSKTSKINRFYALCMFCSLC